MPGQRPGNFNQHRRFRLAHPRCGGAESLRKEERRMSYEDAPRVIIAAIDDCREMIGRMAEEMEEMNGFRSR